MMGESDACGVVNAGESGYKPFSSCNLRCLASVSPEMTPDDVLPLVKDLGASVVIPLIANLGGEGGVLSESEPE